MSKPGFWRNVGGAIVNGVLSPGTTPYGRNGTYNKTLLRNGLINLGVGAAGGPLAGQVSQFATNRWGGGAAQEAGQKAWGWLADQAITPQGGLQVQMPGYSAPGFDPSQFQPQQETQPTNMPAVTSQGQQPQQLQQLMFGGGIPRDGRSGASAGSSVLAQGKAAQDMVEGMQLAQWLGTRSPYTFRGEK